METRFYYDLSEKQWSFKLKETIDAKYGIEAKAKGIFNTVTGTLNYRVHAKKIVLSGSPRIDGASTPLKLGLGVAHMNPHKNPLLALSAKKHLALLEGPNTKLTAKLEADMDHQGNGVRRIGTVKISHKMPKITNKQDLKLAIGLDLTWPQGSSGPKQSLLLQAKENNWAIQLRNNRWIATYDL